MANEIPDIPPDMQKALSAFRAVAENARTALADSGALVDCRGRTGSGARSFSHGESSAIWSMASSRSERRRRVQPAKRRVRKGSARVRGHARPPLHRRASWS